MMTLDDVIEVIEDARYKLLLAPKKVHPDEYDNILARVRALITEPAAAPLMGALPELIVRIESLKGSILAFEQVLDEGIEESNNPLVTSILQEVKAKHTNQFAERPNGSNHN